MKEKLLKLKFIINRLSLRERAMLSGGLFVVVMMFWLFVFYYPQARSHNAMQQTLQAAHKQTAELIQKRKLIEQLAKDATISQLMAKYQRLKEEQRRLNERIARYERRYIGEKELAKLLYSMLQKTEGVTIVDFSNVDYLRGENPQQIEPQTPVENPASLPPENNTHPSAEKPSAITPISAWAEPVERIQYKLTLKGEYFSILSYLQLLEGLPWQLYWDKLDYKVEQYPVATVVIGFYTLRPKSVEKHASSRGKP